MAILGMAGKACPLDQISGTWKRTLQCIGWIVLSAHCSHKLHICCLHAPEYLR